MVVAELHMTSNANFSGEVPNFVERSFQKIQTEIGTAENIQILKHPNELCLLTLARNHPILIDNLTVKSIDFDQNLITDEGPKGKKKKGAKTLRPETVIGRITTENEREFKISAGMSGKLIEINDLLVKEPDLIRTKPENQGYICVIMPERKK